MRELHSVSVSVTIPAPSPLTDEIGIRADALVFSDRAMQVSDQFHAEQSHAEIARERISLIYD
jgi:hypothetical protein